MNKLFSFSAYLIRDVTDTTWIRQEYDIELLKNDSFFGNEKRIINVEGSVTKFFPCVDI